LPGAQHVFREAFAEFARRNVPRRVVLVHEVGEFEPIVLRVVERHVEILRRHQLADDLVDRAQQLLEGVGRVRGVGDAVHRVLHALGPASRRDVAKAPDAADRATLEAERNRVALQHAPVRESQDVEAVGLGFGVPFLNPIHEQLRIDELVADMFDETPAPARVVVGGDQRRRQAPHLFEVTIVRYDVAVEIDHEDAVGGRFEDGLEHRNGQRIRDSTGFLRPWLRLGLLGGGGSACRHDAAIYGWRVP